MQGVVPLGDFWIMHKLGGLMPTNEKIDAPNKNDVMLAAVTIWRMRSNEVIFRSVELIKNIQEMFKSEKMDRNFLRDIEWINFMSTGDAFIDFLQFRNERLRLSKKVGKKKEEEVEKMESELKERKKNCLKWDNINNKCLDEVKNDDIKTNISKSKSKKPKEISIEY